jgi:hypothetical protein
MKTDRYTKIIHTIIAAALVILVFQNFFEAKSATAANGITKIALCSVKGDVCAEVSKLRDRYGNMGSGVRGYWVE